MSIRLLLIPACLFPNFWINFLLVSFRSGQSYSFIPSSSYAVRISLDVGSRTSFLYFFNALSVLQPIASAWFCFSSGILARVTAADLSISPFSNASIAVSPRFLDIDRYSPTVDLLKLYFFARRSTIRPP